MQYHNSLSKNYLPLFFVVGLLLCFESVLQFSVEESVKQAAIVLLYVVAVLCLQIVLLWFCGLLSRKVFLIAFCFGLVFNIISLKALFYAEFSGLSTLAFWGVTLSLILGAILLFEYLFERQKCPDRWVYLSLIVIFILPPSVDQGVGYVERLLIMPTPTDALLQPWADIKLAKKPNIYLISFDAFIPAAVARKYLEIETLPYDDLVKNTMLNQSRTYSPRVPTYRSLNSLMMLDQSAFPMHKDIDYFSGKSASALSSIAHGNNYQLNTGYSTYYLGKPGAYVDQHIVPLYRPISKTILCIGSRHSNFLQEAKLFGVCLPFSPVNRFGDNTPIAPWFSIVLDELKVIAPLDRPQVTLFYIWYPIGHASTKDYRHSDLAKRAYYKGRFFKAATLLTEILQDLVELMRQIDPTALVMVFGDHGALLSGSGSRAYKGDDPIFAYEDRHRVELGVLKSQNACASEEQAFYYATETYTTPARTLASLFRCLAESPEQLDQLVDFIDPTEEIEWAEMSED